MLNTYAGAPGSCVTARTVADVLQDYNHKLDAEEALDDLRELGLDLKDGSNGKYVSSDNSDSAVGKQGAAGFTNGFANPASLTRPLQGRDFNV